MFHLQTSLWIKRFLQIATIMVTVVMVTLLWQVNNRDTENANGTVSVPIGQLETAHLYHGGIGENPDFTVYKNEQFVARPYETVFVKGSGNALILTGIAKDNKVYQLTITIGKSNQMVSTFDFVQGEGNTNITVRLVPNFNPIEQKVNLLLWGLVIIFLSLFFIWALWL